MKPLYYIILILGLPCLLASQNDVVLDSIEVDSVALIKKDSIPLQGDTLSFQSILQLDSVPRPNNTSAPSPTNYKLSKDAIEKEIVYAAQDSNITDIGTKEIKLYNSANVTYETFNIEAERIVINFKENSAKGYAKKTTNGTVIQRAKFKDGETDGTYHELAYDFDTQKAFVKNLKTQEGEFSILGEKSKFIHKDNDTIYHEDKFYNENATLTTCNLDHPHFGIRTRKLKFVPDKLAILGPSQLVLAGVPTPVVLPFGFLPLIKGQSSGLIFPSNYEYNENWGFGLREIGYYFPINDYLDLRITGDIYTRGSHGIRVASNYKKRYMYSGNVNIGYSNFIQEDSEGNNNSTKTFSLALRHNQDSKAHPYRTIGGSINISGNQHERRNYYDAKSALNNVYRSSFSYNYRFPDSPFKFSMGLEHSQNTQTNIIDLTLPTANLTMRTIQPFKRKNQTGGEKWYEGINLSYKAGLKNFAKTTDTTFFSQETVDNLVTGFSHDASMSFNTRLFKYITVSPSISYQEIYNTKTFSQTFNEDLLFDTIVLDEELEISRVDTTFGSIEEQTLRKFSAFRKVNMGVSLNTQLFATKQFSKGYIRGIRHVIKPGLSFNYVPDTRERYEELVRTDLREEFNEELRYSPFPRAPFAASLNNLNMGINWSLNNTVEAKYYSKKDSTVKKVKILENWTIRGDYNFAADSMRWNNVVFRGNSRLFKGLSTFDFTLTMTPYELERGTKELNSYLLDNKKFPLQLKTFRAGFNTGITFNRIFDIVRGKGEEADKNTPKDPRGRANTKPKQGIIDGELPSLTSLFDNFRLSHNYRFNVSKNEANRDTFTVSTHTIGISGNLQLTKNWSLRLGNISYNLETKRFVYPDLSFQRDLHCWTMSFGWYPESKVYNFFIGAKSSTLSFLKYDYGQNTFGGNI